MSNALYGHSQDLPAAMPLIRQRRPRYWKAINPDAAAAAECAALGVKLIVRHYGPWDDDAGQFTAASFYRDCAAQPWFPHAWAIETPNEPYQGREVPNSYIQQETSLVQLLGVVGKECVVSNRSTGWDGHYVPGATYYGAHEYGWPELFSQTPLNAERYCTWMPRILQHNPAAKLFITECGTTHAVIGGLDVGFRSEGGCNAPTLLSALLDYTDTQRVPSYMLGAFPFQIGGNSDWSTFEMLGTEIADAIAALHDPPVVLAAPVKEKIVSDYPKAKWIGSPNYGYGTGPQVEGRLGERILAIVLHRMGGSLSACDNWFNNPANKDSSAHYGVGFGGEVHQYVKEANAAWASGVIHNLDVSLPWLPPSGSDQGMHINLRTIHVEHEGQPNDVLTPAQLAASLALVRDIAQRRSIPLNRLYIVGHSQIYDLHNCPGPAFPWATYMAQLGGGADVTITEAQRVDLKTNFGIMYGNANDVAKDHPQQAFEIRDAIANAKATLKAVGIDLDR